MVGSTLFEVGGYPTGTPGNFQPEFDKRLYHGRDFLGGVRGTTRTSTEIVNGSFRPDDDHGFPPRYPRMPRISFSETERASATLRYAASTAANVRKYEFPPDSKAEPFAKQAMKWACVARTLSPR